ncbi:MAG: 3'-5' exonuclease domain-containing protein 2 [Deltaproteobacteria bacterium]|jgi:ribonuclease D|nr:3'-5' exonuclease domain-containing protein 2 [Deltaproteobacteria bacterium]
MMSGKAAQGAPGNTQGGRLPDAPVERYRRKLRSEEINALPVVRYEGEVRLVRSEGELEEALALLAREELLGFDTETRPSFRKGRVNQPSLIQLAASDRIFLLQLAFVPFGAGLAALLSDESILKVGVGIWDDMRELGKLHPFEGASAVDLGDLARSLKLPTQGLRNMAANLLGWRISKGSRCSNWSLPDLSPRQIAYAATDAWIGRELYLKMREVGLLPP